MNERIVIKTRDDLKRVLETEKNIYWTSDSFKDKFLDISTCNPRYIIRKYIILLRLLA